MSRAVGLNGFWGALRSFGVLGVALVSEGLGRLGLQELRPSKGGGVYELSFQSTGFLGCCMP